MSERREALTVSHKYADVICAVCSIGNSVGDDGQWYCGNCRALLSPPGDNEKYFERSADYWRAECDTLRRERDAAEARAVRCECVIRDAAHLMATRMEGTPIVESYGAAYRVLFGYLHPDAPLPKCEQAGSMVTLAARR